MLNKLMKHEFIATGRIMGAVYAVVVLILAYVFGSYYINKDTATTGQMLGIAVSLLISTCSFFLTAVVMITNFQNSLYGDRGYLSFTLPVKGSTLLVSKILTSTVWFIAAFGCFMGTIIVSAIVMKEDILGEDTYSMIESILPMFLGGKTIATVITTVIIDLIDIFIKFAVVTIEMYFAITLANIRYFQNRYTLWTIAFTVGVFYVVEKISSLFSDNLSMGLSVTGNSISFVYGEVVTGAGSIFINLVDSIVYLVFGAALYCVTFYLMNKKINIK